LLAPELAEARIAHELVVAESLPPVQADRGLIEEVLTNLVRNAREALGTRGGRVRALSLIQPGRSDLVPEVPGFSESGVAELASIEALSWTAMLAPAGTPADIIGWWVTALREIMADAGLAQRLAQTFIQASPPDAPEEFGREIARDLEKWTRVVRAANIEPT
jgi:tripartite-type tricarboxylate transporter receptor subunit TctC